MRKATNVEVVGGKRCPVVTGITALPTETALGQSAIEIPTRR